jgi:hypothetical protein
MCDILDPNLECAMAEKPGASLKIWPVFEKMMMKQWMERVFPTLGP